jgi:hypothetical protein
MLTTLLMTLLVPVGQDKKADPSKDDPPGKKELFAKEDWYRSQEGKEQEFVGVLEKSKDAGGIGFGRMNPYRLVMKGDTREVYVGGKPQILADYVGKTIKLTGKAVNMEVEGNKHREIWPARLEVVPAVKKEDSPRFEKVPPDPEVKKAIREVVPLRFTLVDDTKDRELKVQGRGFWRAAIRPGNAQQLVLNSATDAAKAQGLPADGKSQEQATANLARALKVEKIDWDKQTVIVVTAGAKPTGGYRVEVQSLPVKDGTLTVKWKLHAPEGFATQAFTHPGEAVLVDKFEGKVTFDPAAPKGSGEKDK